MWYWMLVIIVLVMWCEFLVMCVLVYVLILLIIFGLNEVVFRVG